MATNKQRVVWVVLGTIGLWWVFIGAFANISFIMGKLGPVSSGVIFLVSLGIIAMFAWGVADEEESLWNAITDSAHRVASKVGLVDSRPVVEGAIAHNGTVWVYQQLRDGSLEFSHRACPSCQLELVERHTTRSDLNPDIATDGGRTVNALSCPHCAFAIRGQKEDPSGADAARSQFKSIIAEMRNRGENGIEQWERTARETVGADPTPADVWDVYTKEINDSSIRRRTADLVKDGGHQAIDTYPAFDRLQRSRGVHEAFVEWSPEPLDIMAAKAFRTDYLDRKEDLKHQRERARSKYTNQRDRIQRRHQDTLTSLTQARTDRVWPSEDASAEFEQLADDIDALIAIRSESEHLLTGAECKRIRHLSQQFEKAEAYYRRAEELRADLKTARSAVSTFEAEFDPYSGYDIYLETAVEERLRALLSDATAAVETVQSTVDSSLGPVPTDAVTQLEELSELVDDRNTAVDTYESRFVDHETDEYPAVFETDYGSLNERQTLAVVRDEPYNLVDASAGTGKTLTLTRRFHYLYEKGTPLTDIVAITFTNDAAEEMKTRIAAAAGHLEASRLNVMTFHALAREICSQAVEGTLDGSMIHGGDEEFLDDAFADDSKLRRLAPEAMETFLSHRKHLAEADPDVLTSAKTPSVEEAAEKRIRSVFKKARNFDRTPAEIRAQTDQGDLIEYHAVEAVAALLEVYTAYGESRDRPIDHDHSMERAIELVNTYPDRYVGRYDHLLVDEFQDVSERELAFIEALLGPESHLFAVGDDWQSIHGFRGSKPAFFREFESRFGQTSRTTLEVNYRSPPSVVQAGSDIMLASEDATTKEARADSTIETTPVLHRLKGPYTDRIGNYLADRIQELVEDGASYDDIMILARNNDKIQETVDSHLTERGIPTDEDADSSTEPVTIQTIHSAKGTEAPYVFVANAVDDQYEGLPQEERQKRGMAPIIDDATDHYEEERRLFYVAVTRTEQELHMIVQAGAVSRHIESIESQFATVDDHVEVVEGKLLERQFNRGTRPHTVTLDSGSYTAHLMTWDEEHIRALEEGGIYRFNTLTHRPNSYDPDLEITEDTSFRRIQ
ncbi:UvrD-helicase domain-containing protein [Halobium palmae]|uniref:DNA 3'-5' helicase n=1 Tax=Halobium palmae TaxID=1776492 RepID=A0ABD5RUG6_9EURY